MCNRKIQWPTIPVWWQKKRYCSDMPNVVSAIYVIFKFHPMNTNKNILSYDMKRKFINSDNHKFHQYKKKQLPFILTELEPSWSYGC